MKAMSVYGVQASRKPLIIEWESSCWESVLLFEDPSLLQYSGLLIVGYRLSLKEKSGSRFNGSSDYFLTQL